jgi:hypothetical protein
MHNETKLMNNKLLLSALLVVLGLCAAGTLLSVINRCTEINTSSSGYLTELESTVWKKLALAGASKTACDEQLSKNRSKNTRVHSTFKNISKETQKLCLEILPAFGINPVTVSFYGAKMPSSAASHGNSIYIDEEKLNTYSIKGKKYIIGHELIHFIYQDMLMDEIIMQKTGLAHSDSFTCPLNEFRRFTEIRADILCAEHGPDYADGYLEYISYWMEKSPAQAPEPTHPSDEERLVLARQMTHSFKNNTTQA